MSFAENKFMALVYAVEQLALDCPACDGCGTVWKPDARTCEPCEPIRKVLREHRTLRYETMSLGTRPGEKVIFHHPRNGQSGDIATGKKHLKMGQEYTVNYMNVYEYSSTVYLVEFPGIGFNSVQFVNKSSQP